MRLRTSQCYPTLQKEVGLSQSVSCRVFHTSHCCLCAFSLIASLLTRASLCGQRGELFAFFFTLLSLLITLVSHATLTQMHTVF